MAVAIDGIVKPPSGHRGRSTPAITSLFGRQAMPARIGRRVATHVKVVTGCDLHVIQPHMTLAGVLGLRRGRGFAGV
jgi:hypothetical protein